MTKSLLSFAVLVGLLVACLSATSAQFAGSGVTSEEAKDVQRLMKDAFYELEVELGEKLVWDDDDKVTSITLEKFNEDIRLVEKAENTVSTVTTDVVHLAAVKRAFDQDAILRIQFLTQGGDPRRIHPVGGEIERIVDDFDPAEREPREEGPPEGALDHQTVDLPGMPEQPLEQSFVEQPQRSPASGEGVRVVMMPHQDFPAVGDAGPNNRLAIH